MWRHHTACRRAWSLTGGTRTSPAVSAPMPRSCEGACQRTEARLKYSVPHSSLSARETPIKVVCTRSAGNRSDQALSPETHPHDERISHSSRRLCCCCRRIRRPSTCTPTAKRRAQRRQRSAPRGCDRHPRTLDRGQGRGRGVGADVEHTGEAPAQLRHGGGQGGGGGSRCSSLLSAGTAGGHARGSTLNPKP